MRNREVSKKEKYWSLIGAGVFFIFFIYIFPIFTESSDTVYQNLKREFYQSTINNTIKFIKSKGKGKTEFITDDNKYYKCDLYAGEGRSFHDVAGVGDSIYKPANSDTLYLYRFIKDRQYFDMLSIYVDRKYHCIEPNE